MPAETFPPHRILVFTGAGVSAESGLGTFRGQGGLWEKFRPEELATPEAFARDPGTVWRWYAERFAGMRAAEPNAAHREIARWQELFASVLVVTQNIDRLHQRAGSRDVVELHGDIWTARCNRCGFEIDMPSAIDLAPGGGPPKCGCGGLLRPGVVWFGERLPRAAFERAAEEAARADLFVAAGTSASVYPAAGLIEIAAAAGAEVVEINREETPLSHLAHRSLREPAGTAFPLLTLELLARGGAGR
ncbi:MAG: NAD-dependent deacylase [Thermoanaerobaculia bacterium]